MRNERQIATTTRARRTCSWLVLAVIGVGLPRPVRADAEPVGVMVTVGSVPVDPLVVEARRVGGAQWRGEVLVPQAARPSPDGEVELARLRQVYLEADFLRCLAMLQDPALDVDRLLERGRAQAAGQVAVLSSACAHASGEPILSRRLLRYAFVRELPTSAILSQTRPDFQELAEGVRAEARRVARLRVVLRARPAEAKVRVDGGAQRCDRSPCSVWLIPGEHLLVAQSIGYAPRAVRQMVSRSTEVVLTLDPADPASAREQISEAVASHADPGEMPFLRAVAGAFGAQIVGLAWREGRHGHALLFDRRGDRIVSRVTVRGGADHVKVAVRSALAEWRGAQSPPFYLRPVFYLSVLGTAVAAATSVALYFALRPTTVRHDLVFR